MHLMHVLIAFARSPAKKLVVDPGSAADRTSWMETLASAGSILLTPPPHPY